MSQLTNYNYSYILTFALFKHALKQKFLVGGVFKKCPILFYKLNAKILLIYIIVKW